MVRPIPPMKAATLVPGSNSPPGQDLTNPTHSIPVTVAASAHSPFRIWVSAWLIPNAFTSISTEPGSGTGPANHPGGRALPMPRVSLLSRRTSHLSYSLFRFQNQAFTGANDRPHIVRDFGLRDWQPAILLHSLREHD